MRQLALLLALLSLGACELRLEASTAPPPGATGVLDNTDNIITLSRGVALGVTCFAADDCRDMQIEVDDPAIAEGFPTFATELDYTIDGPAPRGSLVVVGKSVGETLLHIDAEGGSVTYEIRVRE